MKRCATKVRVPEINRWALMYESGMTLQEIATKTGRPKTTVFYHLRRRIPMRPDGPRPGHYAAPSLPVPPSEPIVCGRRICSQCGRWRHITDFAYDKHRNRHKPYCYACRRQDARRRYAETRETMLEYQRIWIDAKRHEQGRNPRPLTRAVPPDPKHSHNGPDYLRRRLDLEPLLAELDAWSRQHNGNGTRPLAQRSGVSEKRVSDIVHRRTAQVSVPVADKLLVAMGLTLKLVYPDA